MSDAMRWFVIGAIVGAGLTAGYVLAIAVAVSRFILREYRERGGFGG